LSRTLVNNDRVKIVLFGFAAGQELSEHTASMPAVLQFISGEAAVKLGDEWIDATANSLVHMNAGLVHAIRAKTPTVMLLLLLKSPEK
jgi:quercetin dioxygenase-like cupin family protein